MPQIENLISRYTYTRKLSEKICEPLHTEDYVIQPVVDVSPPKWHLGHTTWFFETFILLHQSGYKSFHDDYSYLFNSYYNSVGDRVIRANRGNMSRPTVEEIYEYRHYVDENMVEILGSMDEVSSELKYILDIGINHEQQHQELLLTDIKFILGHNPLFPNYAIPSAISISPEPEEFTFLEVEGGLVDIGYKGNGFCYDNELGRHKQYLENYLISNRVVSNGEYLEFIESGGYSEFSHWLSEGWDWVSNNGIKSPLYWHYHQGEWYEYKLSGFEKLDPNLPVTHMSYFEADAFASWKGCRIPTEFEWEWATIAFSDTKAQLLLENSGYHPRFIKGDYQLIGNVWEWTNSAYLPYPGFKKAEGALGEYNGKFMVNQKVLRGGSVATPENHIRNTYRNFFQPHLRWQFTGIRLAK